jgi:hypothetical protein
MAGRRLTSIYGFPYNPGEKEAGIPPLSGETGIDVKQTPMPLIAGILVIVSEAFKLLLVLGALFVIALPASLPRFGAIVGVVIFIPLLALTAVAIAGGIFAIMRQRWGWALAGAIISILPFNLLGVGATVLVALSRNEFKPLAPPPVEIAPK